MPALSSSRLHRRLPSRGLPALLVLTLFPSPVRAGASFPAPPDPAASPSLAFQRASPSVDRSPSYYFEIAECRKEDKDSEDDSGQLRALLINHAAWRSTMEPTDKRFLDLKSDCESKGRYCDIVSISEQNTGEELTFTMQIYTTPSAHASVHASSAQASPSMRNVSMPQCSIHDLNETECRKRLMNYVISNLEAFDRHHPLPPGDR